MSEALIIIGFVLLVGGIALASIPAATIVAGVCLIAVGLGLTLSARRAMRPARRAAKAPEGD